MIAHWLQEDVLSTRSRYQTFIEVPVCRLVPWNSLSVIRERASVSRALREPICEDNCNAASLFQWTFDRKVSKTIDVTKLEVKTYTKLSCCCDSRSYCARRSCRPLSVNWNCGGQHEYLFIYSFRLKSAFDAGSLLLMPASFLAVRWFVVKRYFLQQKCPKK